jgi:hypothetical protein
MMSAEGGAVMLSYGLAGAAGGAACGLLPLFVAHRRGASRWGIMSLVACAAIGAGFGILFAAPLAVLCAVILLFVRRSGAPPARPGLWGRGALYWVWIAAIGTFVLGTIPWVYEFSWTNAVSRRLAELRALGTPEARAVEASESYGRTGAILPAGVAVLASNVPLAVLLVCVAEALRPAASRRGRLRCFWTGAASCLGGAVFLALVVGNSGAAPLVGAGIGVLIWAGAGLVCLVVAAVLSSLRRRAVDAPGPAAR